MTRSVTPETPTPCAASLPKLGQRQQDWGEFHDAWIEMLRQVRLTRREREVFDLHVAHHNALTGESWLSEDFISKRLQISTRTVQRASAKLRACGLLTPVASERARHPRLHESKRYRLPYTEGPPRAKTAISFLSARKLKTTPRPSGAKPSQDPITPDLPAEERAANLRRLASLTPDPPAEESDLKLKRLASLMSPPPADMLSGDSPEVAT
jgi:hypothetical protein